MQEIVCNSGSMPVYKSMSVELNDDGTYTVVHILTSKEQGEIRVEFPRVKITVDYSPEVLSLLPPVIPSFKCEALKAADGDNRLCVMSISPMPTPKDRWCNKQMVTKYGDVVCLAHLTEGRFQKCPYIDNEDRLSRKYPCADYHPEE